jgi:putative IMPACT (imprinted ancient) family translation regulator
VREVLTALPRAVKVPAHVVQVVTPYSGFERVRRCVTMHHGEVLSEDFGAEVTVVARLAVERFPAFEAALQELSSGRLIAQIVEEGIVTVMPLERMDFR